MLPRHSLPLMIASVVAAAEGLLLAVLAIAVGVEAGLGMVVNVPASVFMTICGLLAGAGLVLAARGLLRCRRWARAPALLAQIIAIPVGVALGQAGAYAYGVPLGLAAVVAAVALLSPPTTRALVGEAPDRTEPD